MQVLADTLYRQPVQSKSRPAAARDIACYARMGSGRSLAARVRDWFARGWTLYLGNARDAAPITHL
ncbi:MULTISPECIES: hypothetical protein [Cupriavidus]|uniref:hypothetical protein n=1 Tax=Cupriavidus sp. DF5525 TaxID=3160989 RepID=UPI0003B0440A|nr:hypothetical protein N234_32735 [Ralstonia pickettii DTP0602]